MEAIAARFGVIAARMEAIAARFGAIAARMEAIEVGGWRPSLLGLGPSLPSLLLGWG